MPNNFFNLKKMFKGPDDEIIEIGIRLKENPVNESDFKIKPSMDSDINLKDDQFNINSDLNYETGSKIEKDKYLKRRTNEIPRQEGKLKIMPFFEIKKCDENQDNTSTDINNNESKYLNTNNPDFLSLLSNIKDQLSEIMSMIPKLNDAINNNEYINKSNNLLDNILNDLSEDMYPSLKNIEYNKINDIKEKIYNLKDILHSITPKKQNENGVCCVEISTPQSIDFAPQFINIFKDILHNISNVELSSKFTDKEEKRCPICHQTYPCEDKCEEQDYPCEDKCEEEDYPCEDKYEEQDYPEYENAEIILDNSEESSGEEFDINKIITKDMKKIPVGENPFAEEMTTILADLKIAHGLIKQSQKYNNVPIDSILLLLSPTKYNYIDNDIANDLMEIYTDISDNIRKANYRNGLNKVSYLIDDDRNDYKQEFYISDWHPTETRNPNIPYNYQYWLKKVGDTHHKVMARLEEQKNPINKIMALRIPDGQRSNPIREEVAGIETRMMRNNVNTSKVDLHNVESRMHGRNNKEQITTYEKKPKTSPNFNNLLEQKRSDKFISSIEDRLDNKRNKINKFSTEGEINKIRKDENFDFSVYEEMLEKYRNKKIKTAASTIGTGLTGFDNDMWGTKKFPASTSETETKTNNNETSSMQDEEDIVDKENEMNENIAINEVSALIARLKKIIEENDLDIELDINISLNEPNNKTPMSPQELYNNTSIEEKLSQKYANEMRNLNNSIDPNSASPEIHMGNQLANARGSGAFDVLKDEM